MKNIILKASFIFTICLVALSAGTIVFAYQNPTANAGPDLYVSAGQTVNLQGSGYDPQGSPLTYYWNCSGGSLSNSSVAQPTFTTNYPNNYAGQTTYTCSLTVTNSFSLSSSDTMTVYVNYNNNNNNNNNGSYVQTDYATYISNFEADLNGNLYINNINGSNYYNSNYYSNFVYFQWGTTTSYGNETPPAIIGLFGHIFPKH
ncbi:MAG: PKD domain-containing protein [Candidatus Staskawiczbacteria bacterium]|jgi:hypothetical protein